MIHFPCSHCGTKLKVPDTDAGKTSRCPRCQTRLTIPSAPESELKLVWEEPSAPARGSAEPPPRSSFPAPPRQMSEDEVARERRREQEVLASLGPLPAPKPTGVRKLPGLIDILLYPVSLSGIITLLAIVIAPFLFGLVPLMVLTTDPWSYSPAIVLGLYASWYLAECVYDSAKGGTRAPELFDADVRPGELWSRVSYLLAVDLIFVLPAVLYWLYSHHTDAIFAVLVAWAVVFFPMGLLAMVIHDSTSALNPLFLLVAIFRVFVPYVGLLLLMVISAGLLGLVIWTLRNDLPPVTLGLVALSTMAYTVMIMAHVLGRFYWRYRDRLDWGI